MVAFIFFFQSIFSSIFGVIGAILSPIKSYINLFFTGSNVREEKDVTYYETWTHTYFFLFILCIIIIVLIIIFVPPKQAFNTGKKVSLLKIGLVAFFVILMIWCMSRLVSTKQKMENVERENREIEQNHGKTNAENNKQNDETTNALNLF